MIDNLAYLEGGCHISLILRRQQLALALLLRRGKMDAVKEKSQSAQEEPEAKQEIADTGDVDVKQESVKADEGTVSDSEVRERLLLLLGQSDLATTTEKKLRKQLELEFGVKLADRKSLIREEVRTN